MHIPIDGEIKSVTKIVIPKLGLLVTGEVYQEFQNFPELSAAI